MKQKIISLFIFCLLFSFIVCGQSEKKSTYNLGFDPITQGIYLGFDHAIHNYSIGLDVGSSFGLVLPLNVSVSLDNAVYFAKPNKYNLKTWHVNARLAYTKLVVENKPNILHIVPSVGKIFSLNEKVGLNLELGVAYQVLDDWGEPMIGGGTTYYFDQGFTPNIRIELKF
jgi:hypothetical protein